MTPSLSHPPSGEPLDSVADTEDHPTMTPSLSHPPSGGSLDSVADTEDHPKDHTLRISDLNFTLLNEEMEECNDCDEESSETASISNEPVIDNQISVVQKSFSQKIGKKLYEHCTEK